MQVRCIKAFGYTKPGDIVEVPDGAAVDSAYFVPVTPVTPAAEAESPPPPEPGDVPQGRQLVHPRFPPAKEA